MTSRTSPADGLLTRRSRRAGAALVVVLLGVSAFSVWVSTATSSAAGRSVYAGELSDDYARAASAVAAEESLERKYRLEPGPRVQAAFNEAASEFVDALREVDRDGQAGDRSFVATVLEQHFGYITTIDRLFRAVDAGDLAEVQRIDAQETEPVFDEIEDRVVDAAADRRTEALSLLMTLEHRERTSGRLVPLVFVVGLALAGLLAHAARGHRRLLLQERSRAVHDSLHDGLTGLPNRALLADRFAQALRGGVRDGTSTGLLLIDLDRFKEINDTFGHHYGDELLRQVGPRLRAVLRDVDTVARLGGDEFAVLLPGVRTTADALAVAEGLRAVLEAPFSVGDVDLDVEASIGVVRSGEHGDESAVLLQRADIAMYAAKAGNLGVAAYDPSADGHSPARLALLGDLRRALGHDELLLHYQPKVATGTGDVVSVEALVRWQHPDRGLLFPDAFIPLAEHTGLMVPLTAWVLDAALAQASRWAAGGRPLAVSVNLSARNLLDDHLPASVRDLLRRHGVPAHSLELEITESALMTEPARARRLLTQLAALGVRISIDDFGAGYTSLSQLKTLPVDVLKIDRSFVMTMTEDRSNALIVQSVVDLGHNLGLTIVAEGVETAEALADLRGYGCDVAQGFHLSRPVPAEALDAWLQDRTCLEGVPRG